MWNAQSHQIWQKSRPVAFNLASDTRASVTAALAELGVELELSGSRAVAPARTRDRMDPGAQIRALRASFRGQTVARKRDPFRGA